MSIVVVTEFPGIAGKTLQTMQVAGPRGPENFMTVTAGAVTSSFSCSTQTNLVRICSTVAIAYDFGATPLATTTSTPLPASTVEYRAVNPGDKFSFLTT